jgi:hypothetical protein
MFVITVLLECNGTTRMAKTKLPKDIRKKVEEWKSASGALVMCLVVYYDGKQVQSFQLVNTSILWHLSHKIYSVESSPVVGNTFTNSCDNWRDGTYENFKEWTVRQFGVEELDSNDEEEVPVHKQKSKDMVFKKNSRGHFVLPPKQEYKTNRQRQKVIRGYIGTVYHQSIYFVAFISLSYSRDRRIHW